MLLINSLRYSIVRVIVRVPKNLKKKSKCAKGKISRDLNIFFYFRMLSKYPTTTIFHSFSHFIRKFRQSSGNFRQSIRGFNDFQFSVTRRTRAGKTDFNAESSIVPAARNKRWKTFRRGVQPRHDLVTFSPRTCFTRDRYLSRVKVVYIYIYNTHNIQTFCFQIFPQLQRDALTSSVLDSSSSFNDPPWEINFVIIITNLIDVPRATYFCSLKTALPRALDVNCLRRSSTLVQPASKLRNTTLNDVLLLFILLYFSLKCRLTSMKMDIYALLRINRWKYRVERFYRLGIDGSR